VDEESMIKILLAAPNAGETHDEANKRKEAILGSVLGRLSAVESRGMWLRMSREREGDPLSLSFFKLPSAARERLMSMLLDERRHKSIAATRR
jgi:hypothetical protein